MKNRTGENERTGIITAINGMIVRARGVSNFGMREMVFVSDMGLLGEIIRMEGNEALIQVYEDTSGVKIGEPVTGTGRPLSIALGPGLLGAFLDGIGRPLNRLYEKDGIFLARGTHTENIDMNKSWQLMPKVSVGESVSEGKILLTIPETSLVEHRVMTPNGVEGTVEYIAPAGYAKTSDIVAKIRTVSGDIVSVRMFHYWGVRTPRPYSKRLLPDEPLITGQRVIDGLFPISKGGVAAIPGGFGTGKTVTQHQLAKWSDAQIVVYVGCGERGNEMTQVLEEIPGLEDPRSRRPLMERTILIANTSNMPVAAREASIYTGITIAEYYRDMGYDVAMMADSTSRWAEALREISGRLEEIPAEEGFPAYLPTRLAEFYERAGKVVTLGENKGSISVIGAVSPPGGDFTEPVTRHTKRFIRCFWALDANLAHSRHFPAISWMDSYSEYGDEVRDWYETNVDVNWGKLREEARRLLSEDDSIQQTIRLMGEDVLPDSQKLIAFTASLLKNAYLQQNSFTDDSFCPPEKGIAIIRMILNFYVQAKKLVSGGCPLSIIRKMKELDELIHVREINAENKDAFDDLSKRIMTQLEIVGRERLATHHDNED
jgi:V/A-type H+-transporting ATPase subunit A